MDKRRAARAFLLLCGAALCSGEPGREDAVADKYADWAARAVARGDNETALAFLERARDYASASSDLSYMLALMREARGLSAPDVLAPALLAIETGLWKRAAETDARLVCARAYLRMRRYADALAVLDAAERGAERELLRLRALAGLDAPAERAELEEALDRYPYDAALARFAFGRAAARGVAADGAAIAVLLARIPALREADPSLAFDAAPFAGNEEDARALLAEAYAECDAAPPQTALPALLRYGVIDEAEASRRLFSGATLDAAVVREQFGLLRSDEARAAFRARLLSYGGAIVENGPDGGPASGGAPFARAEYENGLLVRYTLDAAGDGLAALTIEARAGVPHAAVQGLPPARRAYPGGENAVNAAFAVPESDLLEIRYAEYPAVAEARLTPRGGTPGVVFRFRPRSFFYAPVVFETLAGPYGLPFPRPAPDAAAPGARSLWAAAWRAETRGGTFAEGDLVLILKDGVIKEAKEYVAGRLAAEDVFSGGALVERRADMDVDGTLETRLRLPEPARFDAPADYLRRFHGGAP